MDVPQRRFTDEHRIIVYFEDGPLIFSMFLTGTTLRTYIRLAEQGFEFMEIIDLIYGGRGLIKELIEDERRRNAVSSHG